jgi:nitroimidazol reductase NimA-like FMN-containing flavoprotein (pyridoxamine 5'-phosphate oxidase superfamily)
MKQELCDLAVQLSNQHRIMTIATNRVDRWPQATVVGYANEGLTLYCFVSRLSQKYANIARDNRVSIAIASDVSAPDEIRGLSLAAKADQVEQRSEFDRVCDVFMKRYPEYASLPRPDAGMVATLRITPQIISVLDYSKGFGHSDLVTVSPKDFGIAQSRSNWLASA